MSDVMWCNRQLKSAESLPLLSPSSAEDGIGGTTLPLTDYKRNAQGSENKMVEWRAYDESFVDSNITPVAVLLGRHGYY